MCCDGQLTILCGDGLKINNNKRQDDAWQPAGGTVYEYFIIILSLCHSNNIEKNIILYIFHEYNKTIIFYVIILFS